MQVLRALVVAFTAAALTSALDDHVSAVIPLYSIGDADSDVADAEVTPPPAAKKKVSAQPTGGAGKLPTPKASQKAGCHHDGCFGGAASRAQKNGSFSQPTKNNCHGDGCFNGDGKRGINHIEKNDATRPKSELEQRFPAVDKNGNLDDGAGSQGRPRHRHNKQRQPDHQSPNKNRQNGSAQHGASGGKHAAQGKTTTQASPKHGSPGTHTSRQSPADAKRQVRHNHRTQSNGKHRREKAVPSSGGVGSLREALEGDSQDDDDDERQRYERRAFLRYENDAQAYAGRMIHAMLRRNEIMGEDEIHTRGVGEDDDANDDLGEGATTTSREPAARQAFDSVHVLNSGDIEDHDTHFVMTDNLRHKELKNAVFDQSERADERISGKVAERTMREHAAIVAYEKLDHTDAHKRARQAKYHSYVSKRLKARHLMQDGKGRVVPDVLLSETMGGDYSLDANDDDHNDDGDGMH